MTAVSQTFTRTDALHPELAELIADRRAKSIARYAAATVRILLGFEFLWAFGDKLLGWGKATPTANAWINGGSPTKGFLAHVKGPFASTFHSMAGVAVYDWLFMAALLGVGVALLAGIGLRVAAVSATALLAMMWAASLPIASNPFLDQHLVYIAAIIWVAAAGAGRTLGLGGWWDKQAIVKRFGFLR
ncbi:MAG: thiosulfate dehydrogenase (quinone) large subunit [Frankiaceae bacterium]|nr:thiosulfate dehydrogenase (quinone) large subunit [Frankiaceae bacterium]